MSYSLSEEEFQEAEYQDLFFRRFTRIWDHILANLRELFTEGNFEMYFALCVEHVVRPWERMLLGTVSGGGSGTSGGGVGGEMRFTELGALRFDKDWRSVAKYLSDQTTSAEVRDKFARLQQSECVCERARSSGSGNRSRRKVHPFTDLLSASLILPCASRQSPMSSVWTKMTTRASTRAGPLPASPGG